MTPLVPMALFGWPVLGAALFLWLPLRQAMLATFLGGWMLLPMATYRLQGLPNYDKAAAIMLGILLGLMLIGRLGRLREVQPHWLDLPMAIWVALPMASSLANGLGVYDGASGVVSQMVMWGLPYWLGRAFFNDPPAVRTMAIAIVVAGLVYVPLCLFEMRFSPQLHNIVYGSHQHDFRQALRFGGYRPMVFMNHGLMVSMFMATAALMAMGLWHSRSRRQLFSIPMGVWVGVLLAVTLMSRSTGAVALLAVGGAALVLADRTRLVVPLVLLALLPPTYVLSRLGQTDLPQRLVATAEEVAGPARAASLEFRIRNEALLMERALEAPLLGWSGWNLAREVRPDMEPEEMPIAESMWILAFGQHGLVGLTTFLVLMILPPILLFRRAPRPLLSHPMAAPVACTGLGTILFAIDSMFNAMLNPMFMLMLGSVTAVLLRVARPRPRLVRQVVPRRMAA